MSISIEYLAKLGHERMVAPILERAWMSGGGSNPVATAMQIVENKRRNRNREILSSVMLALLVLACFAVKDILVSTKELTFAHAIHAAFIMVAFMGTIIAREAKVKEVSDAARSNVVSFCGHLALVADEWCDYESREFYLFREEGEIKKVGTGILATVAVQILRIEKNEKEAESEESKERRQVALGNGRAEFTRRYNTLRRFGMVSGGYNKYYDAAQRIIDSPAPSPIR